MQKVRRYYFFIAIIFSLLIIFNAFVISKRFNYPFAPIDTSQKALPAYNELDISAILSGSRRLVGDIAWIQMLQYYGTSEEKISKDEEYALSWDVVKFYLGIGDHTAHSHGHVSELEGGVYSELLKYTYRTVRLDPYFYYAYLYSAGALAWNLGRPDEAVELLQYGIAELERYKSDLTKDVQEPFWQLNLYMSAIIYRESGDFNKMTGLLETAVRQPGAPNMMKSILANIYQKQNLLIPALKLWLEIYDSNDANYRLRSMQKIEELKKITHI